ncbi:cadherin-like protein 26 [Scleropages formosus]|uniref:cadherin-like protein 26 n=1 Tax=Scleropages formosus TaxID=113540 RepID=UPI0010FABE54|nr:cadherin-like protein 26 [Scleropages formosus]
MWSGSIVLLLLVLAAEPDFAHEREKRELLRRAKRRWVLSTIELTEEDKGPFPKMATKLFNDKEIDYRLKYFISGQGVSKDPKGVFSIDDETGMVYVHKPIDREKNPTFHIEFDVVDRATNTIVDKTLAFDVAVQDINDNPPKFDKPVIDVNVKETTKEGDLPISLSATDIDDPATQNSKYTMKILSQEPALPKIDIKLVENTNLRQLTFKGCFNSDQEKKYKVLVEVKDMGSPSLSSTATVNINIVDGNNHAPVFTSKEYKAEVMELAVNQEILRLKVEDKDLPNTPASRAKFKIVEGNDDGHYKIETDPKTNEGVLTVLKAKNYEKTTVENLRIEVENEEPLFVCASGTPGGGKEVQAPQSVSVFVSVLDVNDPPQFKKKINNVHQMEESEPGIVLFTPEVTDEEGDSIRYELAQDPANWVKINEKTGAITTVHKMDRESPYVNNSIYTILIRAIDSGKPPGTSTGTVYVHLGDINDNLPVLVDPSVVLCGNKENSVVVKANDADAHPFSKPFSFSLQDPELQSRWKFDPDTGESATLHSLNTLAYGNYTVPLAVKDQQGKGEKYDLNVVVCDCGEGSVCRRLASRSSMLGLGGLLALIAAFLMLLLLLLFCLFCECGEEKNRIPITLYDEGCQTLIKYNEEGGGSVYKAQPPVLMTPTNSFVFKEDTKNPPIAGAKFASQMSAAPVSQGYDTWGSQGNGMGSTHWEVSSQVPNYDTQWTRTMSSKNGTMRLGRQLSLASERNVSAQLQRRLSAVEERHLEVLQYNPTEYAFEGKGSTCQSLDQLSFSNYGDNLDFLQDLGPKFNTLGAMCSKAVPVKLKDRPM